MPSKKKIEFITQIRAMEVDNLVKKIEESKLRLNKLSAAHSASSLENPMLIRFLRRDIARMKTLLHQKKNNS